MADQFVLSGSYTTEPLGGEPSMDPLISAPIDEPIQLSNKHVDTVTLSTDSQTAVSFGGVINANIVILKSTAGVKVKAEITSGDGTDQAIPFDTFLILMSMDEPITAIKLTRLTGSDTQVRVFLGEEA